MRWDIFCKVIDNHGDLGVCWRLSRQLAERGHAVRLWVDDARALDWMAPGARQGACANITVLPWTQPLAPLPDEDADVWVEAFGCEIAPEFIAHRIAASIKPPPVWINLEYLSAESYVERTHALPSPVLHGPAAGWNKWFFYPGFTPRTGGLLRESDLLGQQAAFDRAAWRRSRGIADGALAASLFCYEPPALAELLARWRQGVEGVHLLVTAGRAAEAVRQAVLLPPLRSGGGLGWGQAALEQAQQALLDAPPPPSQPSPVNGGRSKTLLRQPPHAGEGETGKGNGALTLDWLPPLPQTAYDELLWACDLNFVRGEDSLVRALWAGQPFVWQIYPQHDGAHHAKLQAFLDWLRAPASLRGFHRVWNGIDSAPLPAPDWPEWRACVQAARQRLLAQQDLASQLISFVHGKGTSE